MVALTWLAVVALFLKVGPVMFIGICVVWFVAVPLALSALLPFVFPGWLLNSFPGVLMGAVFLAYLCPILLLAGIWLAGTRAWDRGSFRAASCFVLLVGIATALGYYINTHDLSLHQ